MVGNNNISGSAYGCWPVIPLDLITEDSIVYSFGAGEDLSYEFLLSGFKNPEIHIFDPTPRSKPHFNFCTSIISEKIKPPSNLRFGGGDPGYINYISNSNANIDRVLFHEIGIYNEDALLKFFHPANEEHVSMSIDNLQNTKKYTALTVNKIESILKKLNHNTIDLLKLNIEGAEVVSLLHMLKETYIRPRIISVKFELSRDKCSDETKRKQTELDSLLTLSYDCSFKKNDNHTFILKKS